MIGGEGTVLLVTVSDDRFGRKDGLYSQTQDKIEGIFKKNPQFGIKDFLMLKWPEIEASQFYKDNQKLLSHTDAGKNGRGYKPYAILEAFNKVDNGDYVVYTDCSPEMWKMPSNFLIKPGEFDIEILKKNCRDNKDILSCFVKWKNSDLAKDDLGCHTHRWFTTNKCIDRMGLRFYEDGYMHASGMLVIRKTEATQIFIEEWLKWNLIDECSALGSQESESDEYWTHERESTKLGHRHDQSISGLLLNTTNHKLIDIVYNLMNPYNFLQFARRDQQYKFIESLPVLNVGDKVINPKGTEMTVWRIDQEGDNKKYIVGKLQESYYAADRQNLKKIYETN